MKKFKLWIKTPLTSRDTNDSWINISQKVLLFLYFHDGACSLIFIFIKVINYLCLQIFEILKYRLVLVYQVRGAAMSSGLRKVNYWMNIKLSISFLIILAKCIYIECFYPVNSLSHAECCRPDGRATEPRPNAISNLMIK